MAYQEYNASHIMKPYIDAFWQVGARADQSVTRIVPDGFMDLIFNFGEATPTLPEWNVGISGMMTDYRDVVTHKGSSLIGVRFKAGAFSQLSKLPLSALKNKTILASEVLPVFDASFLTSLHEINDDREKIMQIESKIKGLIHRNENQNFARINAVCLDIQHYYQSIDFRELAQNHAMSLRQLERLFKANVGVTMKTYQSILRFKASLADRAAHPDKSLLHLAVDHGYYDHAHLTRSIKKMGGQVPSAF